jgi:hypothetical protein
LEDKCGCRTSGHQQPSSERFGGAPGESVFRSGDHATSIGEIVLEGPTRAIRFNDPAHDYPNGEASLRAGWKELYGQQETTNECEHEHDRGDDVSHGTGLMYAASHGERQNRSDCGPGKNWIRKAIRNV